jgi:hypothetical protein
MFESRSIPLVIYIGLISGIILGLILKFIEQVFNVAVYTLLINIDFIPIIGAISWSEPIEFFFHLIGSFVITFIFVYLAKRYQLRESFNKLLFLSFILCLPMFGLYFILSILAIKEVPSWNDWIAFVYWSIGHLIYVWILAVLYKKTV